MLPQAPSRPQGEATTPSSCVTFSTLMTSALGCHFADGSVRERLSVLDTGEKVHDEVVGLVPVSVELYLHEGVVLQMQIQDVQNVREDGSYHESSF
jgi:hypothetical protein